MYSVNITDINRYVQSYNKYSLVSCDKWHSTNLFRLIFVALCPLRMVECTDCAFVSKQLSSSSTAVIGATVDISASQY